MKSIVVKNFEDYRLLLEALFQYELEASKGILSRKAFAARVGLSDSNMRMICSHKRSLSLEKALNICKKLKLDTHDVEHFLNLVVLESIKSAQSRREFQEHIRNFDSDRKSPVVKKSSEDELLDSTLQAILIYIKDQGINIYGGDPEAIKKLAKKFKLNSGDIAGFVERILALDVRVDDPNGVHIVFSKLSNNFRRDEFLKREFQLASLNVKKIKEPQVYFSAKVLSIPQNKTGEFAQDYKVLAEKYMALAEQDQNKENLAIMRVLFHMSPIVS